jgi:hypothetical protein
VSSQIPRQSVVVTFVTVAEKLLSRRKIVYCFGCSGYSETTHQGPLEVVVASEVEAQSVGVVALLAE